MVTWREPGSGREGRRLAAEPVERLGGWERIRDAARARARRLGLPQEEADDCAGAFLLHILRQPVPAVWQEASEAWLHRCAWRFVLDWLRASARRARRERLCGAAADWEGAIAAAEAAVSLLLPGPEKALRRVELRRDLRRALNALAPPARQLVVLRYLEGWSIEEIARHTGRTPAAVSQALQRARRRLRLELDPPAEERDPQGAPPRPGEDGPKSEGSSPHSFSAGCRTDRHETRR